MPRFVILLHELPRGSSKVTHWDLMLESDNALRTWALPELPRPNQPLVATALPDHRVAYLTYEGPISGNRGSVSRWDAGEYRWIELSAERLAIEVRGSQLTGQIQLTPRSGTAGIWDLEFLASPIA